MWQYLPYLVERALRIVETTESILPGTSSDNGLQASTHAWFPNFSTQQTHIKRCTGVSRRVTHLLGTMVDPAVAPVIYAKKVFCV